ncbi:MAG: membrane protein insertase YidC, partial [Marinilabiliales bacterium]
MDRNTIIGIVMILVVIIGFSIINQPSEEELAEAQRKRDSIEAVQQKNAAKRAIEDEERRKLEQAEKDSMATLLSDTSSIVANDSIVHSRLAGKYGVFADAANGEEELFTIENNLLKATLTTKGGKLKRVELKNYKTFDSLPLVLFDGDSTVFGLKFFTENKGIHTNDLFFTSSDAQNIVIDESPKSISMKLMVDESKYIEYQYTVHPDDYMIDFNVNLVGMDDVISKNISYIDLDWKMYVRPQEKGRINENNFTSLFYKYYEDDVDQLSERSDDEEELKTSIKWVAYKQQFFSTVLIANDAFTNGSVHQTKFETGDYLKYFESTLALNYKGMQNETLPMRIYMGPNRYNTLTKYNLELEHMIPLGWGFFLLQWINRFAVIPVFNFLEGFIGNYGIIILILTILLKLVL